MRPWVLSLFVLALAALAGACLTPAPIEGAHCDKAHRCPPSYLCQGARCHGGNPFILSLLCEDDGDCEGDTYCHPVDGLCVQCHAPEHCLTGLCTSAGTCGTCGSDGDCPETGRCNAYGYCAACTADAQCPDGMTCLPGLGQCVQEDRRDATRSGREGRPEERP